MCSLISRIESAFRHRPIPKEVVDMEGRWQIDSDIDDALWLQGRHWRELTCEDWSRRHWGFTYLNACAFAFYLPSILILTLRDPKRYPDLVVQSFVWQLDLSPGTEILEFPFLNRYLELTKEEFDAIKAWMLWACENVPGVFFGKARGGPGDGCGRAFDTLLLLQAEAEKHREGDKLG